jgi:hypothetical protein
MSVKDEFGQRLSQLLADYRNGYHSSISSLQYQQYLLLSYYTGSVVFFPLAIHLYCAADSAVVDILPPSS